MNFKNTLLLAAAFAVILIGNSCHISGNEDICLAPPPNFTLVVVDKNDKEIISKANKDSVKIFYTQGLQPKKYVPDVSVDFDSTSSSQPFRAFVRAYAIFYHSFGANDPIYNLEISGNVIGQIQLKTFIHKEKCNGWHDASEVRFNDKIVASDNKIGLLVFKKE